MFDLSLYLSRIAHRPEAPGFPALAALQHAQMAAIPFENTDPFLGRLPDLSPHALWQKLVLDRRGGYCLELNGLFGAALGALGYSARPILGRVRMGAPVGGPRAHLAWLVTLEGTEYLVDTGFGGPGPDTPVRLGQAERIATALGIFRLRPDLASGEWVLERETPEGWFALYGFDRVSPVPGEIDAANRLCALSDQSPFPANLMLFRIAGRQRAGLMNLRLTLGETARPIDGYDDFRRVLCGTFALPDDPARLSALWTRLAGPQDRARAAR
ncbi:MAG: arylamine N-acetyltransferase [Paracoccaceae bacterium]|nr:arylamine N-acetyltransferase [Paracoccaceae bacterium]